MRVAMSVCIAVALLQCLGCFKSPTFFHFFVWSSHVRMSVLMVYPAALLPSYVHHQTEDLCWQPHLSPKQVGDVVESDDPRAPQSHGQSSLMCCPGRPALHQSLRVVDVARGGPTAHHHVDLLPGGVVVLGAGVVIPVDDKAGQCLHQSDGVVPLHVSVVTAARHGAANDEDRVTIINSTDISDETLV